MATMVDVHIERLRSQLAANGLGQVTEWLTANTYIKGKNYSFVDHEFQEAIASSEAMEIYVRKCSQIGLSELSVRIALACCNLEPGFTVIYTLPTSRFAGQFSTTRIDPIIDTSPTLSQVVSKHLNNNEIKQFGQSYMYIKGTHGSSAAISIPADMIISDEVDFSDLEVLSNYESRLTHSRFKLRRYFSTPTVAKYGVSKGFEQSRRHWYMLKCSCCGHQFVPDYFEHVRLPGYRRESLRQFKVTDIDLYDLRTAFVECPKCGGKPDLGADYREWVCENTEASTDRVGFQVQPFDAPNIITMGDLIKASTRYARYADFVNFNLGLPAEDHESSFSKAELEAMFVTGPSWNFATHVMGVDMGKDCHIMVAGVTDEGQLRIVHTESVEARLFEKRKTELCSDYRVISCVTDLHPYAETIWRLQRSDPYLWAAQFVTARTFQPYELLHKEGDTEAGTGETREVRINRNMALDSLMTAVRNPGEILVREDENKGDIVLHMMDMKRIKDMISMRDGSGQSMFVWRKSPQKNDHFHHALLYCWLAAKIRGMAAYTTQMSPVLGAFRMKNKDA